MPGYAWLGVTNQEMPKLVCVVDASNVAYVVVGTNWNVHREMGSEM